MRDESRFSEDDEPGFITGAGAGTGAGAAAGMSDTPRWAEKGEPAGGKSRKKLWIGLAAAFVILAGLGVGLGVGLTQRNRNTTNAGNASAGQGQEIVENGSTRTTTPSATSTSAQASATPTQPTFGLQGSTILLANGTNVTYDNPYGGRWVWDPENPFNNTAQAQSYTPALNEQWKWGQDKVHGVNVGGWLVTEPFIVSGLYEKYANGTAGTAVDEYSLSLNMGAERDAAMDEHYATFITEADFIEMVSNGINWIRLPFGFWALETYANEPYYPKKSWEYVLLAIQWARKYGIRVNLDMHAHPGSQNGWNHSGKIGSVNWMKGLMGLANGQRSLEYVRTVTQFISQPEYAPVVQLWGFINEPNAMDFGAGKSAVGSYYNRAYQEIRAITGFGEGKGPMVSVHDGFIGISQWYDFLPGADRLALDQHPYLCFQDQNTQPISGFAQTACNTWAANTNNTMQQFGMIVAGEWSAAVNDCGQWLNAVGAGTRWEGTYAGYTGPVGGSCAMYNDYTLWSAAFKQGLRAFVVAEIDAFQDYFFWTWRCGPNSMNPYPNPMWNYQLGLREGWIPKDPREAIGTCQRLGVSNPFSGEFSEPYMTGGPGAGTLSQGASASYPWPPRSLINIDAAQMSSIAQFTQTGTPLTAPAPTFTSPGSSATINAGDGWAQPSNSRLAYVPVSGCTYPPEYSAVDLQPSAGICGAGRQAPTPRAVMPVATGLAA